VVPEEGIEPPTYRLQGGCSAKLSYSGVLPTKKIFKSYFVVEL
tara:strand:+ start:96 stop:224 length:129 start_codon:yes stop_codon:yes gene_type:complete